MPKGVMWMRIIKPLFIKRHVEKMLEGRIKYTLCMQLACAKDEPLKYEEDDLESRFGKITFFFSLC